MTQRLCSNLLPLLYCLFLSCSHPANEKTSDDILKDYLISLESDYWKYYGDGTFKKYSIFNDTIYIIVKGQYDVIDSIVYLKELRIIYLHPSMLQEGGGVAIGLSNFKIEINDGEVIQHKVWSFSPLYQGQKELTGAWSTYNPRCGYDGLTQSYWSEERYFTVLFDSASSTGCYTSIDHTQCAPFQYSRPFIIYDFYDWDYYKVSFENDKMIWYYEDR